MLIEGLLKKAQIEPFTDAGKPSAASMAYRVIYVTDLVQLQISDGSAWKVFQPATSSPIGALFPIIIGSAAQVTAGTATNSTWASALSSASTGDTIGVLAGSWTENVVWTKKNNFVGSGHGSLLTGSFQWSSSSSNSSMVGIKFTDNMTVDAAITGLQISKIWFAAGKSFIDNSTALANNLEGYQE